MTACLLCILFESPRCVKLNGAALHTEINVLIFWVFLKISESHYMKLIDHFTRLKNKVLHKKKLIIINVKKEEHNLKIVSEELYQDSIITFLFPQICAMKIF